MILSALLTALGGEGGDRGASQCLGIKNSSLKKYNKQKRQFSVKYHLLMGDE